MKTLLTIIRWIVGLLFIFSGLIKANDPLGLSYKMQEFFEVWGITYLNSFTLSLALVMNVFEVLAGVAVIIGWRMRLFSWLLLLLIIFFAFLTGYAFITGKVKTCGCFGDCIPLTSFESFIKDLILFVLILILFANREKIKSAIAPAGAVSLLGLCIVGVVMLQDYVLHHLPVRDCLPYKVGANIMENMRMPEGARPDSFALTFKYKKDGKIIEFDNNHFPADFDSAYEFVDRYQKLVKEGTDLPKIVDFALQTANGNDTTSDVLSQQRYYVMLFANNLSNYDEWHNKDFDTLLARLHAKNLPFFLVTSDKNKALELLGDNNQVHILICDGTVIKTAARVNPTYFVMHQADIKGKYSYEDIDKVFDMISQLPVN